MRTGDVTSGCVASGPLRISRHAAIFEALTTSLLRPQLENGASMDDLISIIWFNDHAETVMRHVPFCEAIPAIEWLRANRQPKGHGKYAPALMALQELLTLPAHVPLASVNVLFFSDGRPSDQG